jgi:hypothetical protein
MELSNHLSNKKGDADMPVMSELEVISDFLPVWLNLTI